MSTAEIGLSVRTTNCLEDRGIFTVNDLLHCTREDLLEHLQLWQQDVGGGVQGLGGDRLLPRRKTGDGGRCVVDFPRNCGDGGAGREGQHGYGGRTFSRAPRRVSLWHAVFAITGRNEAIGGPAHRSSAERARRSSGPCCCCWDAAARSCCCSSSSCPSGASITSLSPRLAKCSTSGSASGAAKMAPCSGPKSRSNTRWAAQPIAIGTTTFINTKSMGAMPAGGRTPRPILDQFALAGTAKDPRYPCWYDPTNPYVAVLVRGYHRWVWWAFTVPASFVVIGAGGLIYTLLQWGKSAEQRAVMAQRAQERDFFGAGGGDPSPYLFVPAGSGHHQQPRHAAQLPSADDQVAGLGPVRRAWCSAWSGTCRCSPPF